MPKLKGTRWGLVVGVGLASALGCNAILGNEEGHLPSDEAGGDGNVSGTTGTGGKGSGGKTSGSGGIGTSTGGVDGAGAPGAAGEPGNDGGAGGAPSAGTGGLPTATGGKSGTGGTSATGGKSSTGGTVGSGGAAKGGTFSSGGTTGPSTGGTAGRGGTTSTGGALAPQGGAPGTGGTAATCAITDPSSCTGPSTVRYCESGSYRAVTCATRCPEIGFDGSTAQCSSGVCMCGAGLDAVCEQGTANYCSCAGCTQAVYTAIYVNCYQGTDPKAEDATVCWATASDCTDGATRCGT